jgi:hypothetical protein
MLASFSNMTLIFTPTSTTRFGLREGYAFNENLSLEDTPFSELPNNLISWLSSQLHQGEAVSQVVLEEIGTVPTGWTPPDENGTQEPTGFRPVINAAVSVVAAQGKKTFPISSESLPDDLRDALVAAWQEITQRP